MLAHTFKTAKDLKLKQEVYDTLVQVYWMLSDGVIPARLFDMATLGNPKIVKDKPCGSAGCIMGWCNAINPGVIKESLQLVRGLEGPKGLNTLCFSKEAVGDWFSGYDPQVTTIQAAQAIHNYLTTGRANWRSVLKG